MNWESYLAIPVIIATFFVTVGTCCLMPFSWESAQREAHRQWEAGNESATVTRRWYGWVVVHSRHNAKSDAPT